MQAYQVFVNKEQTKAMQIAKFSKKNLPMIFDFVFAKVMIIKEEGDNLTKELAG